MMELSIETKNVYGKETIYPKCEKGLLLAGFKGQKTFTESDLKTLKQLGYSFRLYSKYTPIVQALGITENFIGV